MKLFIRPIILIIIGITASTFAHAQVNPGTKLPKAKIAYGKHSAVVENTSAPKKNITPTRTHALLTDKGVAELFEKLSTGPSKRRANIESTSKLLQKSWHNVEKDFETQMREYIIFTGYKAN